MATRHAKNSTPMWRYHTLKMITEDIEKVRMISSRNINCISNIFLCEHKIPTIPRKSGGKGHLEAPRKLVWILKGCLSWEEEFSYNFQFSIEITLRRKRINRTQLQQTLIHYMGQLSSFLAQDENLISNNIFLELRSVSFSPFWSLVLAASFYYIRLPNTSTRIKNIESVSNFLTLRLWIVYATICSGSMYSCSTHGENMSRAPLLWFMYRWLWALNTPTSAGGTSLTSVLTQETSGSLNAAEPMEAAVVLLLLLKPKDADFLSLFSSSPWAPQSNLPSGEAQSERLEGLIGAEREFWVIAPRSMKLWLRLVMAADREFITAVATALEESNPGGGEEFLTGDEGMLLLG